MIGSRVRHGLFLPWPYSGFKHQRSDIIELWQFKKGGAPYGRIVSQRLGKIPGGSSHKKEMVMTHPARPYFRRVSLQETVQVEAMFHAGVDIRAVKVPE